VFQGGDGDADQPHEGAGVDLPHAAAIVAVGAANAVQHPWRLVHRRLLEASQRDLVIISRQIIDRYSNRKLEE
jgi:hypothetical protein